MTPHSPASVPPDNPPTPRRLPAAIAQEQPRANPDPSMRVSDAKARLLLWAEGNDARQRRVREKLQPVALGGLAAVVGGMLLGRVLTPRRGRPAATASIIGKLGSAVLGSVVMARVRKMI